MSEALSSKCVYSKAALTPTMSAMVRTWSACEPRSQPSFQAASMKRGG